MNLIAVVIPVHVVLDISNVELRALRTRAEKYLGTLSQVDPHHQPVLNALRLLERLVGERHGIGPDTDLPHVVISMAVVPDLALLACPTLSWAGEIPDRTCVLLNHLYGCIPLEIPAPPDVTIFVEGLQTACDNRECVEDIMAGAAHARSLLPEADQARPRRLRLHHQKSPEPEPEPS